MMGVVKFQGGVIDLMKTVHKERILLLFENGKEFVNNDIIPAYFKRCTDNGIAPLSHWTVGRYIRQLKEDGVLVKETRRLGDGKLQRTFWRRIE